MIGRRYRPATSTAAATWSVVAGLTTARGRAGEVPVLREILQSPAVRGNSLLAHRGRQLAEECDGEVHRSGRTGALILNPSPGHAAPRFPDVLHVLRTASSLRGNHRERRVSCPRVWAVPQCRPQSVPPLPRVRGQAPVACRAGAGK